MKNQICAKCKKKIPQFVKSSFVKGEEVCGVCYFKEKFKGSQRTLERKIKEYEGRIEHKKELYLIKEGKRRTRLQKKRGKDSVAMRKYWNERYANDPKRHDLCECGQPKQKNSQYCLSCHNKNTSHILNPKNPKTGRFMPKIGKV